MYRRLTRLQILIAVDLYFHWFKTQWKGFFAIWSILKGIGICFPLTKGKTTYIEEGRRVISTTFIPVKRLTLLGQGFCVLLSKGIPVPELCLPGPARSPGSALYRNETRTALETRLLYMDPRGYSLIWAIRGRAAGQGMLFWPHCPKQGENMSQTGYGY